MLKMNERARAWEMSLVRSGNSEKWQHVYICKFPFQLLWWTKPWSTLYVCVLWFMNIVLCLCWVVLTYEPIKSTQLRYENHKRHIEINCHLVNINLQTLLPNHILEDVFISKFKLVFHPPPWISRGIVSV